MEKMKAAASIVILLSFIISVLAYSYMPDSVATHWDAAGNVDGYAPKYFAVLIMPLIAFAVYEMFVYIPRIDPLKSNIKKFRKHYDKFMIIILAFLLYIHILTILYNVGFTINIGQFMMPGLGVLFYYCGTLIKETKRNWFIGIKTPWTLSSDKVWKKTHDIVGDMFKAAGVIGVIGFFFMTSIWLIVMVCLIVAFVIFGFVYSYVEYQELKKKK